MRSAVKKLAIFFKISRSDLVPAGRLNSLLTEEVVGGLV